MGMEEGRRLGASAELLRERETDARRGKVDPTSGTSYLELEPTTNELMPPGSQHGPSNSSFDSSSLRRHSTAPTLHSYIDVPSSPSLSTRLAALTPPPLSPIMGTTRPPRIRYSADWNPSQRSSPSLNHLLAAFNASHLWLGLYFCFSVAMTLSNKFLLRGFFPFPWLLTSVQLLCGTLGTLIASKSGAYRQSQLTPQKERVLQLVSLLVGFETLISNASLNLVTVPFHISVRALAPLLTLLANIVFFHASSTIQTSSCLLLVALGAVFTSHGLDFTSDGSFLTLIGTFLLAIKSLITTRLIYDTFKLHPLDFLARLCHLGLMHCAVFAWWNGELSRLWTVGVDFSQNHVLAIVSNGVLSFMLFLVSVLAEKRTQPSAMAISTHAAQAVTIVAAVLLFNLSLSTMNFVGVALTLGGGILYARSEEMDEQALPPGKLLPD